MSGRDDEAAVVVQRWRQLRVSRAVGQASPFIVAPVDVNLGRTTTTIVASEGECGDYHLSALPTITITTKDD